MKNNASFTKFAKFKRKFEVFLPCGLQSCKGLESKRGLNLQSSRVFVNRSLLEIHILTVKNCEKSAKRSFFVKHNEICKKTKLTQCSCEFFLHLCKCVVQGAMQILDLPN